MATSKTQYELDCERADAEGEPRPFPPQMETLTTPACPTCGHNVRFCDCKPAIPTAQENPDGLHQRYNVTKANGEPCDPRAVYFVLRLDSYGDPLHVEACRWVARMWAENAPRHLRKVAKELVALLDSFKQKSKKPERTIEDRDDPDIHGH